MCVHMPFRGRALSSGRRHASYVLCSGLCGRGKAKASWHNETYKDRGDLTIHWLPLKNAENAHTAVSLCNMSKNIR